MRWRLLRLLAIALVLGFWALYLARGWESLATYPWQPHIGAVLAALGLYALSWLCLGAAWQQALRSVGGGLTLPVGIRVWVLSTFMRYTPGNVWHVAGRIYLARQVGEAKGPVLASSALEQVLTVLAGLAVFLLSLPLWSGRAEPFLPLLGLLPVGLVAIHPALWRRLLPPALARLGHPVVLPALSYLALCRVGLWYALYHGLAGLGLAAALAALGPIDWRQLPFLVGAQAIAWIAGYLSFLTPGGLGVREGTLAWILTPVFGFPAATAVSLLARVLAMLAEALVAGAIALQRR